MSGSDTDTTVIARTVTRLVVPIILLTAVALLLQGHNLPGGGFIAGVLTCTAFALVYIIYGRDYLRTQLVRAAPDAGLLTGVVRRYYQTFAFGLVLAVSGGLAFMVVGGNFLEQLVVLVHDVPIYHEIELASALWFDLGVYFVVVGSILTILGEVGAE